MSQETTESIKGETEEHLREYESNDPEYAERIKAALKISKHYNDMPPEAEWQTPKRPFKACTMPAAMDVKSVANFAADGPIDVEKATRERRLKKRGAPPGQHNTVISLNSSDEDTPNRN